MVPYLREAYHSHVEPHEVGLMDQFPILVGPGVIGVAKKQNPVALRLGQREALVPRGQWRVRRAG